MVYDSALHYSCTVHGNIRLANVTSENVRILKEREVPPAPMKKKEGPIVDKLPDPEESSEKSYEAMPATAKAKLGPNALISIKRQGKQKGNIKNATETTNKYDSS